MTSGPYDGYQSWKGWAFEDFGAEDPVCSVYFAKELARCGHPSLAGSRVLELGFGNGAFATWSKSQGACYSGIEAIPELVKVAREVGFEAHLAGQPLVDLVGAESIDLVVAFDVFEHLPIDALARALQECWDCLRVGGQLIGRVPSGDSPFARAVQHGDLTHRSVIGSSAIRQIATQTGFEVVSVRAPVFPLLGLGFGVLLRRIVVSVFRGIVYPLIKNVLMGGGSPVLTPNMVFLLRKQ